MAQKDEQSIIKQIQAILAKAASTDSLEERDSFILGAQKLLQKYNLDMSHVTTTIDDKGNTISEDSLDFKERWETELMDAIARNNFCKVIWWDKLNRLNVVGKPGNIAVVVYLYKFYHMTLLELSIKSYLQMCKERCNGLEPSKKVKKNYIYEYLIGGCQGIGAKLRKQKQEAKENGEMAALMVLNDGAVDEYFEQKYPKCKEAKAISVSVKSAAWSNGYSDGSNINTYNAVTSGAKQIG